MKSLFDHILDYQWSTEADKANAMMIVQAYTRDVTKAALKTAADNQHEHLKKNGLSDSANLVLSASIISTPIITP